MRTVKFLKFQKRQEIVILMKYNRNFQKNYIKLTNLKIIFLDHKFVDLFKTFQNTYRIFHIKNGVIAYIQNYL